MLELELNIMIKKKLSIYGTLTITINISLFGKNIKKTSSWK
tara:strand:+ start:612 stop:734 length:123 start_codon:yes stop_codon:yes gene_type:complete